MIEIPDYLIKESIGEGGMATVYRATHKRLQREIALKIMTSATATTEVFKKNFFIEGRIVAKLDHPNIVKIYDINSYNGHFYMSMELLTKGSLKLRLDNGKLPISNALTITAQIADALNYAHKKGYIHRDIKPANIMFREDGNAILTDFGIAKMQGTTGDLTQMGYISGTPYYMSPEQATGNNEIDNRSDIYSLGVMFYEMLTGTKPFTGSNTVAITYEHVHGSVPALKGENSVFQPIIDKALAKDPKDRFNNIEDFSKALYLASESDAETLLMRPIVLPEQAHTKSKPIWPWIVSILFISCTGIIGTYYYSKSTEEKRIQEKMFELQKQVKQQKADERKKKAEMALQKAQLETEITKRKVEELEIATEKRKILSEKIKNHLSLAGIRNEKRRIFDHSYWSKGCKQYLVDVDGPYDPKDSSEWHNKKVLSLDKGNDTALNALVKINTRKKLEFSDCDGYQRSIKKDPLEDLFKN